MNLKLSMYKIEVDWRTCRFAEARGGRGHAGRRSEAWVCQIGTFPRSRVPRPNRAPLPYHLANLQMISSCLGSSKWTGPAACRGGATEIFPRTRDNRPVARRRATTIWWHAHEERGQHCTSVELSALCTNDENIKAGRDESIKRAASVCSCLPRIHRPRPSENIFTFGVPPAAEIQRYVAAKTPPYVKKRAASRS
jgi:hypothetical protein